MKIPRDELTSMAQFAGFAISTAHGQGKDKIMPVSDYQTLETFAKFIIEAMEKKK